jgi:hypothetical protein
VPEYDVAIYGRIQEKQKKVFVVSETNAIKNPRTVMVHLQDANSAHSTMMATIRFVLEAPLAAPPFT